MSKAWGWLLVAVWLLTLFGEVMPLSWRAAVLTIPVSLTLVVLLCRASEGLWRPPGYAVLVGWCLLLLIQHVPLPPVLLSSLSPGGYKVYSQTVWVLNPDVWMPLALVPKLAFLGLLQFLVIAGVFFMTVQTGADHHDLGKLLQWFGLVVGVVALTLIGIRLFGPADLFRPELYGVYFRGVTLSLASLVPLMLGCYLYAKPHQSYGKWTKRLVQALRHPLQHLHAYLLVSAFLISVIVISFGSPQIQLSLVCGLMLLSVLLLLRRASCTGCMSVVVFSLVILVVVGLGTIKTISPETNSFSTPAFAIFNQQSLAKDFVLFGAGPGNFPSLKLHYTKLTDSPGHQKAPVRGLSLFSEGGLVGAFLSLCFWIAVLLSGVTGWLRRRNRMSLYLLPGVFAGLLMCFVNGSGSIQPVVMWPGFTGYFLGALLIAIGCFSSSGEPDSVLGELSSGSRWSTTIFVGVLGIAAIFYVGGKAWITFSQPIESAAKGVAIVEESGDPLVKLDSQLLFDPLEAGHWFSAGNYWAAKRDDARALVLFSRALRLNPLAAEPTYRVGSLLAGRGYADIGEKLMHAGLVNSPLSADLQRDYLLALLSRGDQQKAMATLSNLLLLDPDKTGFWLRYFESENLSSEQWRGYLPNRAEVYRHFGDYLASNKQGGDADSAYMQAARLATVEPWVSGELFHQVAAYFINTEDYDAALEVLRLGMDARPKDLSLLLSAGRLYLRLGVSYRAVEIYRKALLLDPDNHEARSMLDSL